MIKKQHLNNRRNQMTKEQKREQAEAIMQQIVDENPVEVKSMMKDAINARLANMVDERKNKIVAEANGEESTPQPEEKTEESSTEDSTSNEQPNDDDTTQEGYSRSS